MASQPSKNKRAPRVDARHALRLVDVIENDRQAADAGDGDLASGCPSVPAQAVMRSKRPTARPRPRAEIEGELVEITALTPEEGGGVTTVTLVVHASAGDIQGERYTLRLLTVSCLDLNLTVGEISVRRLGELRYAEELYRAVIKSLELLGYGSMSRRRLGDKLMARGFSREIAYGAVDYVAERGYMDDADTADRFARRGIAKLWGPRRIKEDLFARGYTAEVIEIAMSELDDVDFAQNCATVIRKKYGGIPVDMAARRKLAAALVRQGYASEHINRAMRDELD